MSHPNNKFQEIYEDEVAVYIANRHHTTSQELVGQILADGSSTPDCLEDNENEILHALIDLYQKY